MLSSGSFHLSEDRRQIGKNIEDQDQRVRIVSEWTEGIEQEVEIDAEDVEIAE